MTRTYKPGSYTKNFSLRKSYVRLHTCLEKGFARGSKPVTREDWRDRSGIRDIYRQLIPMNFFLFSIPGIKHDYIAVDHFVQTALTRRYSSDFALLSLFTFNLAQSGRWRRTLWPDGRVAGWANELVRQASDRAGNWSPAMFTDEGLLKFISSRIDGEEVTKEKVFTNYRYMLWSANVLSDEVLQPVDLRQRWFVDAIQVFWDRQILSGALPASARASTLEDALSTSEIHKLLRCTEDQCRAFARAALREYSAGRVEQQLEDLRRLGAIVA